ncbi:MAG: hypothetical protein ACTSPC_01645 [Candidatus Heimdallarchaeota archaeon]
MKRNKSFFIVSSVIMLMLLSVTFIAENKGVPIKEKIVGQDDSLVEIQKREELWNQYLELQATSNGLTKMGVLDVDFGNAYRIETVNYLSGDNDVLIVSGLSGGVTFIDVSDSQNPEVLGSYYSGGTVYDAAEHGGLCYLALHENGLEILDVSDWDDIESVATHDDGGEAYDLEFLGFDFLYVADGTGGLEIYNFRYNDRNFTRIKTDDFGLNEILGVVADPLNNIAFLMAGDEGIAAIDITTPLNPSLITIISDGGSDAHNADFSWPYLYVTEGASGLRVYNYTDQNNITLLGTFDVGINEYAEFFEWDVGRKGYLSTGDDGYLYSLDLNNLSDITQNWRIANEPGSANDMKVDGSAIYLANNFDLKIFSSQHPNPPILESSVIFAGEPSATYVSGDIGILSNGLIGFDLINLSDITDPILISKYEQEGVSYYESIINNTLVYCATSEGLEVIDISDTSAPTSLATLAVGKAKALEFADNIVYLATESDDFLTINVTVPSAPVELDNAGIVNDLFDVSMNSNYAFVTMGSNGYTIVDISNPAALSIHSTHGVTVGADGIFVNDTVLAIAELTNGVQLYDITNINSITGLDGKFDGILNVTKVVVDGDDLIITAKEAGVYIINASDPSNLGGSGYFDDGGSAVNLMVYNEIIYIADDLDSFEVIGKDTDYDRLADFEETNIWTTDPFVADTDADGILDGDEVDYWQDRDINPLFDFDLDTFGNLLDVDSDDDTINDGDEVNFWGSDPNNLDSDADGVSDEDEVSPITQYETHPALSDSDTDGINDFDELFGLLDPLNPAANHTGYIPGQTNTTTTSLNATNPDTDGDIPYDGWEVLYNYNPLLADSHYDNDTDGLNSTMEFLFGSDPYNSDTDGDTISDGDEVLIHGTDPTLVDTDGDYIPDNYEILFSLNPLDDADGTTDNDDDELSNYEEYLWNTDPFNNDTDADGMPDGWEALYNLNPTFLQDAYSDYDMDGLTNLEEYQYLASHGWELDPRDPDTDNDGWLDSTEINEGTDPTDPLDFPETTTYTPTVGIEIMIIFATFGFVGISIVLIKRLKR